MIWQHAELLLFVLYGCCCLPFCCQPVCANNRVLIVEVLFMWMGGVDDCGHQHVYGLSAAVEGVALEAAGDMCAQSSIIKPH